MLAQNYDNCTRNTPPPFHLNERIERSNQYSSVSQRMQARQKNCEGRGLASRRLRRRRVPSPVAETAEMPD
jgi:hypothetical protein